jgi:hypothetical protein
MVFRIRRRKFLLGATATAAAPVLGVAGPAAAAPAPEPAATAAGALGEVLGGTRERLRVRLTEGGRELVLPTRGFASGWVFTAGDLVVVQPTSARSPSWDQAVAEPFTRVVRTPGRLEVWTANATKGPRLAAAPAGD